MSNQDPDFKQNRYKGSNSFEDSSLDRLLFKGREAEKRKLLHLILSEKLVVLYAKSGVGKTSLLQAGVYKNLRKRDYFPVSIRLNNPDCDTTEMIINEIEKTANNYNITFISGIKSTLWQYFVSTTFWSEHDKRLVPVLVFDQFEEIFALDYTQEQRGQFIKQFASLARGILPGVLMESFSEFDKDLYSQSIPEVKIVISMREDFLPNLEELSVDLPTILNTRFRLLPLTAMQAKEAIIEPARLEDDALITRQFTYHEDAITDILDFLRSKKEGNKIVYTDEIEPFQLQLLCQHVEENIIKKKSSLDNIVIYKKDLGGYSGMEKVLRDFYDNQIKYIPFRKRKAVRKICEKKLISHSKRRLSVMEETLIQDRKITTAILDLLIKKRLIRSEPWRGTKFYELSHDTLVQPILLSRKRRLRKRRLYRSVITFFIIGIIFGFFMARDFYYYRADRMKDIGEYKKAIKCYKKYINNHPEDIKSFSDLGDVYLIIHEFDSALKYYLYADEYGWYNKNVLEAAEQLKRGGEFSQAIKFIRASTELKPEKDSLEAEVRNLAMSFEEEKNAYRNLIRQDSSDEQYYLGLGKIYHKYGLYRQARQYYDTAIMRGLNGDIVFNEVGILFQGKDNYDSAIFYFEKAIEYEPYNSDYYYNLSLSYYRNFQYQKSIDKSLAGISIDSSNILLYNQLGIVYYSLNKFEDAKNYYLKAIEIDPEFKHAYHNLGLLYIDHNIDSAVLYYGRALEIDPFFLNASFGLANLADTLSIRALRFHNKKEHEQAVESKKKSIEIYHVIIDLTSEQFRDNINLAGDYGSLSWYQLFNMDFKNAIKSAKEGLRLDPAQTWIYTNLAHGYLLSGQYKEAERIYLGYKSVQLPDESDYNTMREAFLADFDSLTQAGIILEQDSSVMAIMKMLGGYTSDLK